KNAAFTELLDKYKRKGLPGISLLINDNSGTWVGSAGKADISNNIDFVPGTVSKVASITKLFMGTLLFRMMEDSANTGIGFRELDKKIREWLPSRITNKLANGNMVSLGQCLKHETGIPDIIEQDPFYLAVLNHPNKKWTAEELLEYVYDKPAGFVAGDTAVYSNTNTILVTMVMESQTGRKHADLLKQYIINPLGLSNTFYQPHDKLPAFVAQGYYDLYNNGSIVNVSNLVTGSGNGYGGIYSNLFDLLKFADALFIKKTLLQPFSLARMQTYGKQDDTNLYGYGLQKSYLDNGIDYGIGHKGRDLGYTANLFYFPNKKVLHIFFVNYGTDADSGLKDVFREFTREVVNLSLQ
ncbi:MAG TPA: serine hydrolase, partial [Chitinophagaceae bacterium]|nr:serine hydrolase [Chitinophagaceae bacterium]